MERALIGLTITITTLMVLLLFQPSYEYDEGQLFLADICACIHRPMNTTRVYLFSHRVAVFSDRVEMPRVVAPSCASLRPEGDKVVYVLPSTITVEGENEARGVVQVLFTNMGGTCTVRIYRG
mgnify:CR=1 FL=1